MERIKRFAPLSIFVGKEYKKKEDKSENSIYMCAYISKNLTCSLQKITLESNFGASTKNKRWVLVKLASNFRGFVLI